MDFPSRVRGQVREAHAELHAIAKQHDLPRPPLVMETLDVALESGGANRPRERGEASEERVSMPLNAIETLGFNALIARK